jgi:AcrR family transcriptional regulator
MGRRAETQNRTIGKILRATMELHDEKGVAPTTFADIADRAGVGQATVSRHFPSLGDLVRACGQHVWQEMRPPLPEDAGKVFAGLDGSERRLTRLVEEVDSFYARGALRLDLASRDRAIIPELDGFLNAVEAGVGALVREALAPDRPSERETVVAAALMSFRVWQSFQRSPIPPHELADLRVSLLQCGLKAARTRALQ